MEREDDPQTTPRPDPTRLTTEQLYREIGALEKLFSTRLDCMEEQVDRMSEGLNARPDAVKEAIDHLKDMLGARMNGMDALREQKFLEMKMQFKEQNERFCVTTEASKEAVEKALSSAKEAIVEQNRASDLATMKSETNFTKQIDQQGVIIQSQAKNTDSQMGDVKDRLNKLEGMALGRFATEKDHRDNTTLYVAIIVVLLMALGLFLANFHKV